METFWKMQREEKMVRELSGVLNNRRRQLVLLVLDVRLDGLYLPI